MSVSPTISQSSPPLVDPTVNLLNALSDNASRLAKDDLLKEAFLAGERDFFVAARMASDPRVTFGVKKIPSVESDGDHACGLPFEHFVKLCDRLRRREITGHAAMAAITAAAERASPVKWNSFYRRVLLKNLNVGVSHKTVNKVLGEVSKSLPEAAQYILPLFGCQLAQDSAKHPKKLSGLKLVDHKFDGVRLLSFLDVTTGTVTQLTGRNGTPNDNFPHLREELARLCARLPMSVVIDAEVIGKTFKEIMSQISRKDDLNSSFAKLAIFDMIPMEEFEKGHSSVSQEKRHSALTNMVQSGLFQELGIEHCFLLPKAEIDFDTEEGGAQFEEMKKEVFRLRETDETVEGLMIKSPTAGYTVGKKGTDWLKWKPYLEVTLKVIGVEMGDPNKGRAGKIAALVVEGEDDGVKYRTNVSSGITDEDSDAWTLDPSKIMGWMVEIRADYATQDEAAEGTDVWSLRFPRLKGVRGTQAGEKI